MKNKNLTKFISPKPILTAWLMIMGCILLSGCGSGKYSQMTTQTSAVNGAEGHIGDISLVNVYLTTSHDVTYFKTGDKLQLNFTLVNRNLTTTDSLTSITAPQTTINSHTESKNQIEVAGQGTTEISNEESKPKVEVILNTDNIINFGKSLNITFTFAKAGKVTIPVPLVADTSKPRSQSNLSRSSVH